MHYHIHTSTKAKVLQLLAEVSNACQTQRAPWQTPQREVAITLIDAEEAGGKHQQLTAGGCPCVERLGRAGCHR